MGGGDAGLSSAMETTNERQDGDPRVTRVEMEIVDGGIWCGHRWRYRLTRGHRKEDHEMEWMSRPLALFECALRGALDAMSRTGEGEMVRIVAPEHPLVLGMTGWVKKWRVNGWRNRNGYPVRQRRMWETLWHMCAERHVEWVASAPAASA